MHLRPRKIKENVNLVYVKRFPNTLDYYYPSLFSPFTSNETIAQSFLGIYGNCCIGQIVNQNAYEDDMSFTFYALDTTELYFNHNDDGNDFIIADDIEDAKTILYNYALNKISNARKGWINKLKLLFIAES